MSNIETCPPWEIQEQRIGFINIKEDIPPGFDGSGPGKKEEVNHPEHYLIGGMETLDVIKAKLTYEEYIGYCKGNIIKYITRATYKGRHDTDCEKVEFYSKELSNYLRSLNTDAENANE